MMPSCYVCSTDVTRGRTKPVKDCPVSLNVWTDFFKGALPWISGSNVFCRTCLRQLSDFQSMHEQMTAIKDTMLNKVTPSAARWNPEIPADNKRLGRGRKNSEETADLCSDVPGESLQRVSHGRGEAATKAKARLIEPRDSLELLTPITKGGPAVPVQPSEALVRKRGRPRKAQELPVKDSHVAEPTGPTSERYLPVRNRRRPRRYSPSQSEGDEQPRVDLSAKKRVALSYSKETCVKNVYFVICKVCCDAFDSQDEFLAHFVQHGFDTQEMKTELESEVNVDSRHGRRISKPKIEIEYSVSEATSYSRQKRSKVKKEAKDSLTEAENIWTTSTGEATFETRSRLDNDSSEEKAWYLNSNRAPDDRIIFAEDGDAPVNFVEVKIRGEVKLVCRVCDEEYSTQEDFDAHDSYAHGKPQNGHDKTEGYEESDMSIAEMEDGKKKAFLIPGKSTKAAIFKCYQSDCKAVFYSSEKLQRHFSTVHADWAYTCPVCQEVFGHLRGYRKHLVEHEKSGEAVFKCDFCSSIFVSFKELLRHRNKHTKEHGFRCRYCPEVFSTQRDRKDHYQAHVRERPFQCGECSDRFENKRSVNAHMRLHAASRERNVSYKCLLCDESFLTVGERRIHQSVAHQHCRDCGEGGFRAFTALVQHVRSVHASSFERPQYNCDVCGRIFRQQRTMEKHQEHAHQGVAKVPGFQCAACGQLFNDRGNLQTHFNQFHAVEAKYVCHICNRREGNSSCLRRHIERQHEKKKRYKCEHCSETFTYPQTLSRHRRRHTNDRRFECPYCSKGFTRWEHRHTHMFSHIDKKEYECRQCGEGFMRVKTAKVHVEAKHPQFARFPLASNVVKNKPFKYLRDGHIIQVEETTEISSRGVVEESYLGNPAELEQKYENDCDTKQPVDALQAVYHTLDDQSVYEEAVAVVYALA